MHFDPILFSPLLRTQQTAEILQKAGLATQIETSHHLAPAGDIKAWLDWLDKWQQTGGSTLALVGHQPNLGNWAEILVWGEPYCVPRVVRVALPGDTGGALVVKKAGVIGLSLPETGSPLGRCSLFLLAPPKFLLS